MIRWAIHRALFGLVMRVAVLVIAASAVLGGCGAVDRAIRELTDPIHHIIDSRTSGGPVRNLGPVTQRSGCRVHGGLPDRACTPGAVYTNATRATVCQRGYARRERRLHGPTYAEKTRIYRAYGRHQHYTPRTGEGDHLVPIALGGASTDANLWPQPAPAYHAKDTLEAFLANRVCAGAIPLGRAQKQIAKNWKSAIDHYGRDRVQRFAGHYRND